MVDVAVVVAPAALDDVEMAMVDAVDECMDVVEELLSKTDDNWGCMFLEIEKEEWGLKEEKKREVEDDMVRELGRGDHSKSDKDRMIDWLKMTMRKHFDRRRK